MIKNIELEKGAYQFDAKMPLRQAIPLGLQHVFAMFVGNLTPLLIITSACGLAGGEFADLQVSLLQNAMFVAGVVTLVQLFSIGPVGSVIQISAYRKDHQVVVDVADNGPGIPERAKAQVFEMFCTGQSRIADSHRSLGLGLPL